jgi:SPX domain protein involved in polyphosphate accumulation
MCDAQLIERREYKYFVDEDTVELIRNAIRPFCQLDPYSEKSPTHQYAIESLYFDTPQFALFWANDREAVERFKVRVRSYPGATSDDVFLEVKRRANDVIVKSRGRISRSQWNALSRSGKIAEPEGLNKKQRKAMERFLFLSAVHHLRPVALVRYEREAYFSLIDDYARITFDRLICSTPKSDLAPSTSTPNWRYQDHAVMQKTPSAKTLVELKFTSNTPRWLIGIVKQLDLMRSSFSKYGTAVRTWYSDNDFSDAYGKRVPA